MDVATQKGGSILVFSQPLMFFEKVTLYQEGKEIENLL